jgi:hypothetical protein
MKLLVVDIETTGFFVNSDAIVEIGIALVDTVTKEIELVFDNVIKHDKFNSNKHKNAWIFQNTTLTVEDVEKAFTDHIGDDDKFRSTVSDMIDKAKEAIVAGGDFRLPNGQTEKQAFTQNIGDPLDKVIASMLGHVIKVTTGDETYHGYITNIKFKELKNKAGQKVAIPLHKMRASEIKVEIHVNSSIRKLTIPLSQIARKKVELKHEYGWSLKDAFEVPEGEHRVDRWVITGNLVKAIDYAKKGAITMFGNDNGKTITGLLLPMAWNDGDLVRDPSEELNSGAAVLSYMKDKNKLFFET